MLARVVRGDKSDKASGGWPGQCSRWSRGVVGVITKDSALSATKCTHLSKPILPYLLDDDDDDSWKLIHLIAILNPYAWSAQKCLPDSGVMLDDHWSSLDLLRIEIFRIACQSMQTSDNFDNFNDNDILIIRGKVGWSLRLVSALASPLFQWLPHHCLPSPPSQFSSSSQQNHNLKWM